jgi:hypothetical protein
MGLGKEVRAGTLAHSGQAMLDAQVAGAEKLRARRRVGVHSQGRQRRRGVRGGRRRASGPDAAEAAAVSRSVHEQD